MKSTVLTFLIFAIHFLAVIAFHEDAIFEEEDIYYPVLPPIPEPTIIVPGTKWCGPGNVSNSYDDLGVFIETDKCCREHDHCPDIIISKGSAYNLFNPDMFPRMHCKCEQDFMNCLQNAGDMLANTVGRGYFGARKTCFMKTFVSMGCKHFQDNTFSIRCVKYTFNQRLPKKWQFFDIPLYSAK